MKKRLLSLLLAVLMLLSLTACGAPRQYEVRFELNGGIYVSGQLLQHVEAGSAAEAPVVEREGYRLSGWSESFEAVNDNLVVLPLWEKLPELFEVRFDLNGGSLVSGELLQRVEAGSAAVAPVIEREGYAFTGWSESLENISKNLVIVPVWEKLPELYEVRFELNGGTLLSGELLQHVEAGSAAEVPEVEREGFVFDGWSQDVSKIEKNTLAVAQWAQIYRIVFDPAGAAVISGELEQQVSRGELPAPPELELPYYAFAGWEPALAEAEADTSYTALWTPRKLSSEEVFEKVSPAVVEISADEPDSDYYSLGSGFFIDENGLFVTNYHVIDGTVSGEITMQDGTVCPILAVLDYDPVLDLALLQADVSGNPYLRLSEKSVSTGETVYTLGSSEGLTSTFSTGIVSAASRVVDGVTCIQITAPISHGNSGGPLLDEYGEVVGINAMTYLSGQNLNFAIDVHNLQSLRRTGKLSLQEVFDLEYPNGKAAAGDNEFSAFADYYENESNDEVSLADILRMDTIVAGTLDGVSDLDWFCFSADEAGDVSMMVVPNYTDDLDHMLVGVFRLKDGEPDLLGALEATEAEGVQYLGGSVYLKRGGVYLVLVCLDDDYPYQSGAEYLITASFTPEAEAYQ